MQIVTRKAEIVRSSSQGQPRWQQAMKDAVRDAAELCRLAGLSEEIASTAAAADFPVFAPRGYIARMRWGDPHDPLLRQVLPIADETSSPPDFSADPVGDLAATLAPGLLQKYHGRALIVTTGACAVHCRYCFRRHFPYSEAPHSIAAWEPAIAQIEADPTVHEIILSGGDPLTLVDEQLARLAGRLADISHVRRLRVHTRLPVVIPERVTPQLIAWLRGTRLTSIVVIHANHANELDDLVADALGRLVDAGIPLLNQAVLLRGVNDSIEALANLSERLIELRVMPYYLHQLDRVRGAAHFEVPIAEGVRLMEELQSRLPGYAVPRYVSEVPEATAKQFVVPTFVSA
jgi:EF-P beta-lysylation protein EpmB